MSTHVTKNKWCWVSTQTRKGWRLSLHVGNRNYNLKGLLLANEIEVRKVTKHGAITFLHLKEANK